MPETNNTYHLKTDGSGTILENNIESLLGLKSVDTTNIQDLLTIQPQRLLTIPEEPHQTAVTELISNNGTIPISVSRITIPEGFGFIIRILDSRDDKLIHEVETLRQMIDLVPHAIFLKDAERRFLIINKAVADHHQLSVADFIGRRDEDFFSDDDSASFIALEEQLLKDHIPLHKEESFTIENETKFMDSIKLPFYIKHKDQWGILGVSMDITTRKRLLEEKTNLQLEHQKTLMRAVVDTQERERKVIAQDLHDGIGQLLSAAIINLDAVISQASLNPEQSLNTTNELIEQAVSDVRTMTKSLMPNVLKDFGLIEALQKLGDLMKNISSINIVFSAHGVQLDLSEQIEINLYRVVQEIINNALKHSQASEIAIQLFSRNKELIIQIEDDGIGFDLNKILTDRSGLGISNIQNRLDLIDAELDIDTRPNHGCSYSIILKLSDHYD